MHRNSRLRGGFTALTLLLCALAAGPSAAQTDDVLRISTPFPFTRLDPVQEGGNFYVFGAAELLMRFDPDGQIRPWLLENLENIDDTTWRLTLRPDVTFQNGTALTAENLVELLTYLIENASVAKQYFPADAEFAVTGEGEITFTTAQPFPALPGLLADRRAFPIFDIDAYLAADGDMDALAGKGLMTAPYEIVSIDDERLVLKRSDNYWAGEPPLSEVRVEFIVDPNASVLALQNGELDVMAFAPVSLKPLADQTEGLHFKSGGADSLYRFYQAFMNVKAEPLSDPQVRLALLRAIDYREIAEDVFDGAYGVATGFYVPLHPWAVANQATDRAAAEDLLETAGWMLGSDGYRSKDGVRLQIDAYFDRGSSDLIPIGTALQNQLRQLGVAFSMVPVDDPYQAADQLDWDLAMHAQATAAVPETFLVRHMTEAGDRNLGHYDNPEVLMLIDELELTLDEPRRDEILRRIQDILMDEDPYIFNLVFYQPPAIVSETYRDYEPGFDTRMVDAQTAPAL